jgi:outer membrane protein assembly factor BamB
MDPPKIKYSFFDIGQSSQTIPRKIEPANANSHIYGVDINTGRQTWKFPTMNILDSSAAITSNIMLIRSRDGLLYVWFRNPSILHTQN